MDAGCCQKYEALRSLYFVESGQDRAIEPRHLFRKRDKHVLKLLRKRIEHEGCMRVQAQHATRDRCQKFTKAESDARGGSAEVRHDVGDGSHML